MTRIIFENLTVDQVSKSSGIYSGTNIQSNYQAKSQTNEGNGRIHGDRNISYQNKHLIIKKPSGQGD